MTQQDIQTGLFSDLGIAERILEILTKKGFTVPTPIQHQIIPGGLDGKDVIGIAQTGTGKTLAFGIPMIQRVAQTKGQGLIIVPTRELALQVDEALRQIGGPLGLRTVVVIGGTSQHSQAKDIRNNPHFVIATPGRLVDLMDQGIYKLNNVSIITLDEADRMLDVGFLPQIKKILQLAPKEKQTMLFSATMPKEISLLASKFMKLPLRIEVAPQGTSATNVEQEVFVVNKTDKIRLLDSLLTKYKEDSVLIFSRTKHGAKRIARDIQNMGHTATEIHGNRSQPQRKKALDGFTDGTFRIMVATDIAARGIDVKHLALVINYDLPDNTEDYVHRIGRTGRAGRSGRAISFVTPSEKADIRKIESLIRKSLKLLSLPTLPPLRAKPPRQENAHSQVGNSSNNRHGGRNFYPKNKSRSSRSSKAPNAVHERPGSQNSGGAKRRSHNNYRRSTR